MEAMRNAHGRRSRWIGVAVMLTLASPAHGDEIYRWTDRDGRVNYGGVPPVGAKAERIESGAVSVMPALPSLPRAGASDTARRLDRLESELEEERRLRRDAEERADEQVERGRRLRAECEERMREPCDDEGRPLSAPYVIVPPQRVRPPHRPDDRWPPPPSVKPPRVVPPDGMPKPVLPIAPERSREPARPFRGQPAVPE